MRKSLHLQDSQLHTCYVFSLATGGSRVVAGVLLPWKSSMLNV